MTTPAPAAFTILKSGGSEGLTIACDFPATGRTVAGFADLIPALPPTDSLWETSPPPLADVPAMAGTGYVEFWLADLRRTAIPVRAVLGFCVGGVFAAEVASRVAGFQGTPPKVIVFDPERPDADLLHRHYREGIGSLAALLAPAEVTSAQESGLAARHETEDLRSLAAELTKLLSEFGRPAFERAGLDARRCAELVDVFNSFLAYLVAAADLDPHAVWAGAEAVSSATPHSGLNPLSARERAAAVARETRFDVPHTDLLRDIRVGQAVRDLLS